MENVDASELSTMPLVSADKVYQYLLSLDYTNAEGIMFLEQQLYGLLQQQPEDPDLLALLLHEQIMNNRGQRARSIAYKIWESGGTMKPEIEKMYVDDLMNLGLLDMAGAALAPAISELEKNVKNWADLLFKYALISGNMTLLERLLSYMPDRREYNILRDWVALSEYLHASPHIPNIMTRLTEKLQDSMLGFSYNLFSDREVPDIEFVFYVGSEIKNFDEIREMLNLQISSYCASRKIDDLLNLSTVVYPISRHPRLLPAAPEA